MRGAGFGLIFAAAAMLGSVPAEAAGRKDTRSALPDSERKSAAADPAFDLRKLDLARYNERFTETQFADDQKAVLRERLRLVDRQTKTGYGELWVDPGKMGVKASFQF